MLGPIESMTALDPPVVECSNGDTSSHIAAKILSILTPYLLPKAHDVQDNSSPSAPEFLSVIQKYVKNGATVQMCLPAFPFKSANRVYRVFDRLPDKAEEIALTRLNAMCQNIMEIYPPGAKILIVSAGLVYNDLLNVTDREVWAYIEAVKKLATTTKCTHLSFTRPEDLVKIPGLPGKVEEMVYVANATNFRRALLNAYSSPKFDVAREITENDDTRLTYIAWVKLLENDLRYLYSLDEHRVGLKYREDVKYLAKQLIIRGNTLAAAIKERYPDHLRLSVHQSTRERKLSIALLPTAGCMLPWQCSVAYLADGGLLSGPKADFEDDPKFELGKDKHGRPSHFKEKPSCINEVARVYHSEIYSDL